MVRNSIKEDFKKLGDLREILAGLDSGEEFLKTYNNYCILAKKFYKKSNQASTSNDCLKIDTTRSIFEYINFQVIPVLTSLEHNAEKILTTVPPEFKDKIDSLKICLLRLSKLTKDRRFDSCYLETLILWEDFLSMFSQKNLQHAFFVKTGLVYFLYNIEQLEKYGEMRNGKTLSSIDRLEKLNTYKYLGKYKEMIEAEKRRDSLGSLSLRAELGYYQIIDEEKDKRGVMLECVHKVYREVDAIVASASKINLVGLKQPVRWEKIQLSFDGDNIKIKQDDTFLGDEVPVSALGLQKRAKENAKTSLTGFFTALFYDSEKSKLLESISNTNQKHKSAVSKILKELFETNIDPIDIDQKKMIYVPKFKTDLYGQLRDLRAELFRSGKEYNDEIYYENNE